MLASGAAPAGGSSASRAGGCDSLRWQQRARVPGSLSPRRWSETGRVASLALGCATHSLPWEAWPGPVLWPVVRDGCVPQRRHGRHFHGVFQGGGQKLLFLGQKTVWVSNSLCVLAEDFPDGLALPCLPGAKGRFEFSPLLFPSPLLPWSPSRNTLTESHNRGPLFLPERRRYWFILKPRDHLGRILQNLNPPFDL